MTREKKPDPLEELRRLALELSLTALPDALASILERMESLSPSYTEFALELLRTEWQMRRERRVARALKRSRLGAVDGLDGFDYAARPQLEPRVVKQLLDCRFVVERRGVICVGRPGLGKTRVAKALGKAACLNGHGVLFTTAADMLDDIQSALVERGGYLRTMSRYANVELLILDEFGNVVFDEPSANTLFRIVSKRHGRRSTIITANAGFKQWHHYFPSEAVAVATGDRLIDRATILRFTGKSFRDPLEVTGAPIDE